MKPGRSHPSIKSVVLEIDAESRVVRRMVIERMYKGQPFATVTCTLVETETLDDDKFQLEGHLVPPYTIYTRDFEPARRRELLTGGSVRRSARGSSCPTKSRTASLAR